MIAAAYQLCNRRKVVNRFAAFNVIAKTRREVFTAPVRNQILGNNFSCNAVAAITGYYANRYTPGTLAGHAIGQNVT
jgi:hypothetical protein